MDNLQTFMDQGMIKDLASLTSEARQVLNDLEEHEVQQLIDMWNRLGKPAPEQVDPASFVP